MGTGYVVQRMDDYIIPLSRFNSGEGGKILKEVQKAGVKAIFKNNKREAVIMSPELYDQIMEMLFEFHLEKLAAERASDDDGIRIPFRDVAAAAGFTEKDLEGWEDVEID